MLFHPPCQGFSLRFTSIAIASTPTLVSLIFQLALPSAGHTAVNPQLEQQILETIKNHPEVIQESLNLYRKRQQQEKADKAQRVAEEIRNNPKAFLSGSPILGNTQATKYLFIFSDFQCLYCAKAQASLQEFKRKHPEVALVYKHYPLKTIHSEALNAAAASWAAQQQGKFWAYHDILLANQDRLSNAYYEEIAKQLGMNLAQFNRDRKSESSSLAIAKDIQLGDKLGIKGTPFFVINGQGFYGVITDKDLEKIISSPKPMPKNNLGLKPSS